MYYISIDGDNIGQFLEFHFLKNNEYELETFSNKIKNGIEKIKYQSINNLNCENDYLWGR